MAIATSGNGLELIHAKLVPRVGYALTWAVIAACLYFNFVLGVEEVGRTPGVKIPVVLVWAGMAVLPLVCETPRVFADAMQLCYPVFVLSWRAALIFEWAATGNAFMFWFWAPIDVFSIFLLMFRRRYFLLGFVLLYFVGLVADAPILCAMDSKDSSQFLFAYGTYAQCVFRGYYQQAVLIGAVGCFLLFLAVHPQPQTLNPQP